MDEYLARVLEASKGLDAKKERIAEVKAMVRGALPPPNVKENIKKYNKTHWFAPTLNGVRWGISNIVISEFDGSKEYAWYIRIIPRIDQTEFTGSYKGAAVDTPLVFDSLGEFVQDMTRLFPEVREKFERLVQSAEMAN